MTDFEGLDFHHADLAITVARTAEGVTLYLSGTADVHAIAPLGAILPKLHAEVLRLALPEVVIDIQGLEFMNSSCLKAFVSWIALDQDTAPGQQYKIRFVRNQALAWQRRTISALACFAVDLIQPVT
ncbi:MAG: hypothetical protein H0T79_09715 [Deltaproteobacteria bacterium]|nr:hypothetical protein [Deltaproteobacteria bacterium]